MIKEILNKTLSLTGITAVLGMTTGVLSGCETPVYTNKFSRPEFNITNMVPGDRLNQGPEWFWYSDTDLIVNSPDSKLPRVYKHDFLNSETRVITEKRLIFCHNNLLKYSVYFESKTEELIKTDLSSSMNPVQGLKTCTGYVGPGLLVGHGVFKVGKSITERFWESEDGSRTAGPWRVSELNSFTYLPWLKLYVSSSKPRFYTTFDPVTGNLLSSAQPEWLSKLGVNAGYWTPTPSGDFFYVNSSNNGKSILPSGLFIRTASGKVIRFYTAAHKSYHRFKFSPNGCRLALIEQLHHGKSSAKVSKYAELVFNLCNIAREENESSRK